MAADSQLSATPVLVGPDGMGQLLERVPLTQEAKSAFDEAWLQRLVHENPACLPIPELEPGLDVFAAVCREIPTPRGYIDNLLLTGAGDIAVVETKLFRNPEARRKVLAQALDYATGLFAMSYGEFEQTALKGIFAPSAKPASLYEALPEGDKLPEAAFVDAVSNNLRRGNALVLVVGDGIRSEAEGLLDGLQTHARFGFTLALIEVGVFRMPNAGGYLIRPRTLAKTAIVQRTIVDVTGGSAAVKEVRLAVPETLSVQAYWQALDTKIPGAQAALEALIRAAEPLGVYPESLKSLNLKWSRPGARPVNLGYIFKYTSIWTDATIATVPRELVHAYVGDVARAFGCDVRSLPRGGWTLDKEGRPLRLEAVLDRLGAWVGPMQRFITAITQHDAQAG
ncbi:MAG: hypothetical protein J0H14_16755 [Alphaproteobacteria bacterium]|nr:hypothetical protein [Alphaproteobacteria bacterium]